MWGGVTEKGVEMDQEIGRYRIRFFFTISRYARLELGLARRIRSGLLAPDPCPHSELFNKCKIDRGV